MTSCLLKVLLSEQEQREDIASSPAHQIEDNTEEISTSPGAVAPTSMLPPPSVENMDTIRLLTLTQDALLRHTKQQEDLFVAHAKQDRTPIILKSKEGGMLQERKRSHSPDHEKGLYRPTKASRNDSSILIPPFPLPNIGYSVQYRQGSAPRGGTVNGGQQIVSQSGLPVCSTKLSQSNVESRVSPIQSNVIWPYYPQTASGNCKNFHFNTFYLRIFILLFFFKMITMILLVLYHYCNAFNMLQEIKFVNFTCRGLVLSTSDGRILS